MGGKGKECKKQEKVRRLKYILQSAMKDISRPENPQNLRRINESGYKASNKNSGPGNTGEERGKIANQRSE